MKILFTLCILAFACSPCQAQQKKDQPTEPPVGRQLNKGVNNSRFLAEEWYASVPPAPRGIEGSLYLDESWQKARLLTMEGEVIEVLARYRIYDDQMQIYHDGQEKAIFPSKVKAISLADRVFVPETYFNKRSRKETGYFQLLVEGGVNLYLRRTQTVRESDYKPGLNVGNRNDQLETREAYFYRKAEDRPLRQLRQTKSGVLSVLSRRKKAIAEYAKENRLGVKKQDDLVAIFHYYNQLLKD